MAFNSDINIKITTLESIGHNERYIEASALHALYWSSFNIYAEKIFMFCK